MKKYSKKTLLMFCILFYLLFASNTYAAESSIIIGVLAKRGHKICHKRWNSTAEYLTSTIPNNTFRIVPLDFDDINSAIERGEVNFILTNSAMYVGLENRYGVNRIVTMKNNRFKGIYTVFGGVIFSKKKSEIRNLKDLKGKNFMAVKKTSFGGWLMALREFKDAGIDPLGDFSSVSFGGTHDAVVYSVLSAIKGSQSHRRI